MQIFTDAGYKNGMSSHGFIAKHWNGTVIASRSFSGNEDSPIKSEMTSIVTAINWVNSLKKIPKRRIRIYTDCLYIYETVEGIREHDIDVTYLKHQLKRINAKLIWRSREMGSLTMAHNLAHRGMVGATKHLRNDKKKVKYKCEGVSQFKSKKKNKYKHKIG